MAHPTQEMIHDLLVRNIQREPIMGLEEAKSAGGAYLPQRPSCV